MSRTRRGEEAGDIGGPERGSTARHSPSSFTPRQEPEAPAGPDSRQCRRCWLPAAWLGKSSRGVRWGNSWKSQARGDESHRLWEICKLKGSGWGRSEVSQSGDTVGGQDSTSQGHWASRACLGGGITGRMRVGSTCQPYILLWVLRGQETRHAQLTESVWFLVSLWKAEGR